MKKILFLNLVLSTSLYASSIYASSEVLQEENHQEIEELVVEAHPLAKQGISQSSAVLVGDELEKSISASLGDTVSTLAGINNSSFGESVGRPIIHGLSGARVKTTQDRIDSLDVAVSSADHTVTIDPFIADQITVLKGASTLLYGSNAIGGVVDISSGRLKSEIPEKNISGKVEVRAKDIADAYSGAFRLDGTNGSNFAWHIDGFRRDADDYDIPVGAESQALRMFEEANEGEYGHEEEDEHEHGEQGESTLLGSRFENQGGAIGLSWFTDTGFVSFSVSRQDAQYGLIGGHGHEEGHEDEHGEEGHDEEEHGHEEEEHAHEEHAHEEEEEPGLIDMKQLRFDLEAQRNFESSFINKANFRLGINDYEHQEIEPSQEIATRFNNDALELRIELSHAPIANFDGVFGVQYNQREFSAIGEEAFVQPVESDKFGLFWLAERQFEALDLEAGVRLENVDYEPIHNSSISTDFTSGSASVGVKTQLSTPLKLALQLDYTSRAPSIEELYSNGPHFATNSFEIGDTALDVESALSLSLSLNYQIQGLSVNSTVYHMDFDDFIYQRATGEEEDELPVFQYTQGGARFTGIDLNAAVHLGSFAGGDFDITLLLDRVRAKLTDGQRENLPRIPAGRTGLGFQWSNQGWSVSANYVRVSRQGNVASFELSTPEYDDLGFNIQKRWQISEYEISAFIKGKNLLDEEQRHHSSFIKDLAPLPSRYFEAGVRLAF